MAATGSRVLHKLAVAYTNGLKSAHKACMLGDCPVEASISKVAMVHEQKPGWHISVLDFLCLFCLVIKGFGTNKFYHGGRHTWSAYVIYAKADVSWGCEPVTKRKESQVRNGYAKQDEFA